MSGSYRFESWLCHLWTVLWSYCLTSLSLIFLICKISTHLTLKIALSSKGINTYKVLRIGVSLVAQWLRICLLMQGTRVRALVWEDPTCCGATRPVSHNY